MPLQIKTDDLEPIVISKVVKITWHSEIDEMVQRQEHG